MVHAQITLTGIVTDGQNGEALPRVSIVQKGTERGTITGLDGSFTFETESRDAVLVFSYVGYTSAEVKIGEQTEIKIALTPDLLDLEEVYVVGYGIQKKSVVTGSIARVGSDELERTKDTRIEQALQGRTAGVIVMNNSGQPGDNLTIRVRGTGTNRDADPLFIIDGLPMEKEGLDYLNANDVESIEVLKDASSAAIYGTRGANGVIIITTKQGKKGQGFQVSYDGYYGIQNPWRKLEMLHAGQYMDIINEAGENDGRSNPFFSDAARDSITWSTDWQDEMYYYNAPKISHTFSLIGSSDKSTYSSSLSYYSQDGIVARNKSNFERITYRLNTMREFGILTAGSNLNLVNIKKQGIDGNTQYGLGINQGINMQPIVPITYSNGSWGVPSDFGVGLQEVTNPLAMLSYHNSQNNTNKALGNIYAIVNITGGLKFRTDFGGEYAMVENKSYTPTYYIDSNHKNDSTDFMNQEFHKYVRWNWENTLTYEFSVSEHNVVVMAGMTRFREFDESMWSQKRELIFDDIEHAYFDNAQNPEALTNGGYNEHTLASVFGRVNYNYQEKYLLEGVLRRDGSSRFGAENRYGYFPAVSAGWVLSREAFFPQTNALNFAKVRLSWGQNGNENIDNFAYTSTLSDGLIYYFGDEQIRYNGIQPSRYPNAALKWETSQQFDLGTDLTFINNRVSLTLDYYDKRTKDWLIDAPAMLMIGNVRPFVNGGEVKNTGFELEFGYKERIGDLKLVLGLTTSTNKSEVLSINNEQGALTGGEGIKGQGDVLRAEEGQPLGYFWGYKTDGIFQTQEDVDNSLHQPNARVGDLIFVDVNGDSTLDDQDKVNIGNPYPKLIMGLNISLEWKGLDLYMFWYSAFGHQVWLANRRDDLKYANFTTDVLERWHGEGTSNSYPRVTISDPNGTWKRPSDFYVKDADFLRLKSVTLGYTLPKGVLNFLSVEKLRFYVSGENLLTFTKYPGMEMEVGGDPLNIGIDHGAYPLSRTILGGVNITF
jgi:TonB-linked SusC/RagA family outer membrane protein